MIHVEKREEDCPDVLRSESVRQTVASIHAEVAAGNPDVARDLAYSSRISNVRSELGRLYHFKCAFCEILLPGTLSMVGRYRPIRKYPWLACEWANLLPICTQCHDLKRAHFPLLGDQHDSQVDNSQRMRLRMRSWHTERPVLLNPELDDPEEHLQVQPDGSFMEKTERGRGTLKLLKLNDRPSLLSARKVIIDDFMAALRRAVQGFVAAVRTEGRERWPTLLRLAFASTFENLLQLTEPNRPHALVARNIKASPQRFLDAHLGADSSERHIAWAAFKVLIAGDAPERAASYEPFLDALTQELRTNGAAKEAPVKVKPRPGGYLDSCEIDRYFCVHELHLENLADRREVYFLGENGEGKTLLLQGILLALQWPRILSSVAKESAARVFDLVQANPELALLARDSSDNTYHAGSQHYLDRVFAYGVHRGRGHSKHADRTGFMTLFTPHHFLRDPVSWIQKLHHRQLLGTAPVPLERVEELLRDVLDTDLDIHVKPDTTVEFTERGAILQLDQLAEGHRSVMIWVLDLLSRLVESQPDAQSLANYQAVVLVDEVSLHLHPTWEFKLVSKLRTWFPKIQFLLTTHSPITVMGASRDAIFYKVYREGGLTRISEPYHADGHLSELMANAIITSPLFGREHARMRAFNPDSQRVDTSASYLLARIQRIVSQRVDELREQGKVYLTPEFIDDLIRDALADLDDD